MRDGFFYFENYRNIAKNLPDDLRLKFYDALNDYMFEGKEPEDYIIMALITALKPSLDKVETRGGNNNPFGCRGKPKEKGSESKDNQSESKKNKDESKDNQNNQSFNKQETRNKKQEIKNKKQENLNKYGEFKNVCLEEDYYEKLKLTFGEENLNKAIEKLDAWLDNPKQSKQRNHNHRGYFKSDSWVWEQKPTLSVGGKTVVEHNLDWI